MHLTGFLLRATHANRIQSIGERFCFVLQLVRARTMMDAQDAGNLSEPSRDLSVAQSASSTALDEEETMKFEEGSFEKTLIDTGLWKQTKKAITFFTSPANLEVGGQPGPAKASRASGRKRQKMPLWEEEEEEEEEEDVDMNNDYCEVCGGHGELVCCDFCECAYHGLKCLGSKAEDLPDIYKCPKCTGQLEEVKLALKVRQSKKSAGPSRIRSKPIFKEIPMECEGDDAPAPRQDQKMPKPSPSTPKTLRKKLDFESAEQDNPGQQLGVGEGAAERSSKRLRS